MVKELNKNTVLRSIVTGELLNKEEYMNVFVIDNDGQTAWI